MVTNCAQLTPGQARGFVAHALEASRTVRQGRHKGEDDSTTAHAWLIEVRTFFADIGTWGSQEGSPFAAHCPAVVPLTRHDLADAAFAKARRRSQARMTRVVLDLERELPNIRAFGLRRWHEAQQALTDTPATPATVRRERIAFWDWAFLELLITSGLRIEEACELTTLDVLKRQLPDGRLYYLLHVKPSKFDRARVIPIGDQLGRVIAEIVRHVRAYHGSEHVPACDRRDMHEKRPLPRLPYLLQARDFPSAIGPITIRNRLRALSADAGARHADGSVLALNPHDCRRVFATEHLNAHTPVHVIADLLGHASLNTVMLYAKLYPTQLVGLCGYPHRATNSAGTTTPSTSHRPPRGSGPASCRSPQGVGAAEITSVPTAAAAAITALRAGAAWPTAGPAELQVIDALAGCYLDLLIDVLEDHCPILLPTARQGRTSPCPCPSPSAP